MAIKTTPAAQSAYWGVVPTAGDTFAECRITKMEVGDEGSIEPLPDNTGETTGLCGYDNKQPVSLEIIMDATVTPPAWMDTIIVLGLSVVCEKVKKMWEFKGWQKISVDGTCYPNLEADAPEVSVPAPQLKAAAKEPAK